MSKTPYRITCLISGSILLVCIGYWCWAIPELLSKMGPDVGIIGGADIPTATFWLTYFILKSPLVWVTVIALVIFLASGIYLWVKRFSKK